MIYAIGRAILGGFFILAGVNKLTNYAATLDYMANGGVPGFLLPLVIMLEVGGGLIVASGRPRLAVPWVAFALAGFTVLTCLVFHQFWNADGQLAQMKLSLFFKNLAIAGALLMVAGEGLSRTK